mgnify:FL=1
MADSANKGKRPKGTKLAQAASRYTGQGGARPTAPVPAGGAARGRKTGGRPGVRQEATRRRRWINYPRAGKGPVLRWIPGWRFFLGSFLLLIIAAVGAFAIAYAMVKVPEPSEFAVAQTTTVYYADGTTKMGEFADVDRTIIDTNGLPDYIGNAVVASEDRTFYSNNGVDPKGIVRAFVNNMRGGDRQGASTLTQQYVKNYYVDTTSSYSGKFKQAIMAIKIDRETNKKKILGSYLNTVYFGRGAYGIEAASNEFFGHSASEMSVSEAALVAGILPAPTTWDPTINPEKAKERWQRVLDFMLEDGYITQEQHDSATYPETVSSENTETYEGPNGYLLQMVRNELQDENGANLSDQQIDTGGLSIVTTINKDDQDAAVDAVKNLPEGHADNLHVGLVSVDATNGGILALYGGPDYLTDQVNSSTQAVAQAGSTFKPFALIAGLEGGLTLSNSYDGSSPMQIGDGTFTNFQDAQYPRINLVQATTDSVNTAYVQLNRDVGPNATNEVAKRAGYPDDTVGMNSYLQNVLGSASPHTLDIATAYATFASQGVRHDTHIVSTVSNGAGSVSYTPSTDGERAFDEGVMADATYAMQQVVTNGSGKTAQGLGRPVAAKTGSSSDNKSAQFAGYTPQIATAVTLYQTGENGEEESITPWGKYDEITGSTYPADIFTDYMTTALKDLPVEEFPDRTQGSYQAGSLDGTPAPAEADNGTPEQQQPQQPQAPEPTTAPEQPAGPGQGYQTEAPGSGGGQGGGTGGRNGENDGGNNNGGGIDNGNGGGQGGNNGGGQGGNGNGGGQGGNNGGNNNGGGNNGGGQGGNGNGGGQGGNNNGGGQGGNGGQGNNGRAGGNN